MPLSDIRTALLRADKDRDRTAMTHDVPQRHKRNIAQQITKNVGDLYRDPIKQSKKVLQTFGEGYMPTEEDRSRFNLAMQGSVMGDVEPMVRRAEMLFGVGATVWHGSPHKFSQFDSDRIGSGEGAQAYGHGLYLADKKGVAGSYQKAGEGTIMETPKGVFPLDEVAEKLFLTPKQTDAYNLAWQHGFDWDVARQYADERGLKQLRKEIDALSTTLKVSKGNLYKVDFPDTEIAKMLDWDAPLSEQPESVIKALGYDRAEIPILQAQIRKLEKKIDPETFDGSALQSQIGVLENRLSKWTKITGADLYNLKAPYRPGGAVRNEAETSEYLHSLGIPGIKYYDGGSRAAGQGTRNYVVFPGVEGKLKIQTRNGEMVEYSFEEAIKILKEPGLGTKLDQMMTEFGMVGDELLSGKKTPALTSDIQSKLDEIFNMRPGEPRFAGMPNQTGIRGRQDPALGATPDVRGALHYVDPNLRIPSRTLEQIKTKWADKGVDLEVRQVSSSMLSDRKIIRLSRIEVAKNDRKRGFGTQAMEDLIKYADETGTTIALSPVTDFGASSVGRLTKFYKRFGFIENKGKNKDFQLTESMYRKPKE